MGKGYKWEQRTQCPDMKPLTIENINMDGCLNLCIKLADGFIKDYKSAIRYGDSKVRGATVWTCRNDLNDPFYKALMQCIKTNKDAIMIEVGDFEKNV